MRPSKGRNCAGAPSNATWVSAADERKAADPSAGVVHVVDDAVVVAGAVREDYLL